MVEGDWPPAAYPAAYGSPGQAGKAYLGQDLGL